MGFPKFIGTGTITLVVGGTDSPTVIVGTIVSPPRHHEEEVEISGNATVTDRFIFVEMSSITLPSGVDIPALEIPGITLAVNENQILYAGPVGV